MSIPPHLSGFLACICGLQAAGYMHSNTMTTLLEAGLGVQVSAFWTQNLCTRLLQHGLALPACMSNKSPACLPACLPACPCQMFDLDEERMIPARFIAANVCANEYKHLRYAHGTCRSKTRMARMWCL